MSPSKRAVTLTLYVLFSLCWIPFCLCLAIVEELCESGTQCAKAIREIWNEE
jgi:uncharacterized membrane protein